MLVSLDSQDHQAQRECVDCQEVLVYLDSLARLGPLVLLVLVVDLEQLAVLDNLAVEDFLVD